MKNPSKTFILFACAILLSCNTQQPPLDIEGAVLFDMTDKGSQLPTATDLLLSFDLKNQPYQSIRLKISTISEKDFNNTTVLTLEKESEWKSNIVIRKAKIQHFTAQLQQCLTAIQHSDTSSHSIIYRAIIAQANQLAASRAKRKILVVYSNLYENGDFNFYNHNVIAKLQHNPKIIQDQLEHEVTIQSLKGIDVWLIYNATSYSDNNHFRPIANLYQRILEQYGATVHLDNKFQLQ